jgi:hypothetical protein
MVEAGELATSYIWMAIWSDCCIITQVSTYIFLDDFTVYALTGKKIVLIA